MDDLISRKEAENTIRKLLMETAINCADAGDPLDEFYVDIAHNRLETWISLIPAAPVSVPLDKLCELCEEIDAAAPCALCDMCDKIMPEWCKQNNNPQLKCGEEWECPTWKQLLTKWMEEQEANDNR